MVNSGNKTNWLVYYVSWSAQTWSLVTKLVLSEHRLAIPRIYWIITFKSNESRVLRDYSSKELIFHYMFDQLYHNLVVLMDKKVKTTSKENSYFYRENN